MDEQEDRNPNGKDEESSSPQQNSSRRRSPADGFYSRAFSTEEIADLESQANPDDLDDEIALLKVLIRRKMAGEEGKDDKEKKVDGEAIRRYVNTLCQAIRIRRSLGGKGAQDLQDAADKVLTDIAEELGINSLFNWREEG